FFEVWSDTIRYAESKEVKIGIENCPMLFTNDEWPGGKNLATSPAIWHKMFAEVRSDFFGLNYDPSHMIWQHMDYLQPLTDFAGKLFHIHAKDVRIDIDKLNEVGIMAPPNQWHTPKLPGLGQVNWSEFFTKLAGVGYDGPICVEVEDRAFEGSLEKRKAALVQCHSYLRQFIPKNS
ncbi:MAG: sugar phosphate isomerase/epimerase family protein, partial [Cyclobacteriaceae bacterium]